MLRIDKAWNMSTKSWLYEYTSTTDNVTGITTNLNYWITWAWTKCRATFVSACFNEGLDRRSAYYCDRAEASTDHLSSESHFALSMTNFLFRWRTPEFFWDLHIISYLGQTSLIPNLTWDFVRFVVHKTVTWSWNCTVTVLLKSLFVMPKSFLLTFVCNIHKSI